MRHLRVAGLAMLALAFSTSTAVAQRAANTGGGVDKFWEFGVDFASLQFELDPGDNTSIGFGSGAVRAGRSLTPAMTLEPQVFLGINSGGGTSSSIFGTEVGLLYHLQSDRTAMQWYVRPLVMFSRTSIDNGTTTVSDNDTGFGVGFGMKRPMKKNTRFIMRAEATYRSTSSGGTTFSDLTVSGGVSVYNK
jgi:hypothetical protein